MTLCHNCGRNPATTESGGEPACEPCRVAGINHGHERQTLTRSEANDAIDNAMDARQPLEELRDLSRQWIGHPQDGMNDPEEFETFLREYVDECCNNGANMEDIRERGDHCSEADDDDTGIPVDGPGTPAQRARVVIENQLTELSALLRTWCAAQSLPFQCADELRATRADLHQWQRDWLNAYCTLWDLTNNPKD